VQIREDDASASRKLRCSDVTEKVFLVLAVCVVAGAQNDSRSCSDHKSCPSVIVEHPEENGVHQKGQRHQYASEKQNFESGMYQATPLYGRTPYLH